MLDYLLQEDVDRLLQENGDALLLEESGAPRFLFTNVTRSATFSVRTTSLTISDQRPCELARLDGMIFDINAVIELENEDEIELTDESVTIFAGDITRRVRTDATGSIGPRVYQFTAQDFTGRLSDNVITQARDVEESVEDRVAWIMGWSDRGLTFTNVEAISTVIGTHDYTAMSVQSALAQVAQLVNAIFYVDYAKDLHFFQTENNPAPFDILSPSNPPDSYPFRDFQLEDSTPDLTHAVFVRGDGVVAWREMVGAPTDNTRQERSVSDSSVKTIADAEALGDALLAKWSEDAQRGSLMVSQPGLQGGMSVRIANPDWGIDDTFVITSVRTTTPGTDVAFYQIGFAKHYLCGPTRADFAVATTTIPVQIQTEVAQIVADLSIAGANMVLNSSFESTADWTQGSLWSAGWASSNPYHGPKTARTAPTGTATGELVSTAFILVARTADWWFSFWSYLSAYTAGVARCRIREYDTGGSLLQSTDIDLTAVETEWTRHSLRFGPTATDDRLAFHASTAKLKIVFYVLTTPTLTWEVDAIQLERSTLLTSYAPAPNELADGSITTTKIADDAITTPKLVTGAVIAAKIAAGTITANELAANSVTATQIAANSVNTSELNASAVIKLVTNDGATVVIDEDGIAVTDGAITVTNGAAIVIIDGESNMFKIAATGTLALGGADGTGAGGAIAQATATIATGFTYRPAFVVHLETGGFAYLLPYTTHDNTNGGAGSGHITDYRYAADEVVNTNETKIYCVWMTRFNRSAATNNFRYYLLAEAAI